MIRFFKQRWVVAVLAVIATLLFIKYVYPKIKKTGSNGGGQSLPPMADKKTTTEAPVLQSLKSRLVGPVSAYAN